MLILDYRNGGQHTSTGDLPPYVLDRLFDSFSDESLSDVDNRNNDVGELSNRAIGETDSNSIFSCYPGVSDDESDSVHPEDELSMLDDALLPEFDFCNKEKVSVNPSTSNFIGIGPAVMDVLANKQINTSVKYV